MARASEEVGGAFKCGEAISGKTNIDAVTSTRVARAGIGDVGGLQEKLVFGAISAIRASGEMPAFRADGVGSGSVTVGDGGGVIGGDGSGPVVVME